MRWVLLKEVCNSWLQNGALAAQRNTEFTPTLDLLFWISLVQIGALPAEGAFLRQASGYWGAVILKQDLGFLSAASHLQFIGSCSQNRGVSVLVCLLQQIASLLRLRQLLACSCLQGCA